MLKISFFLQKIDQKRETTIQQKLWTRNQNFKHQACLFNCLFRTNLHYIKNQRKRQKNLSKYMKNCEQGVGQSKINKRGCSFIRQFRINKKWTGSTHFHFLNNASCFSWAKFYIQVGKGVEGFEKWGQSIFEATKMYRLLLSLTKLIKILLFLITKGGFRLGAVHKICHLKIGNFGPPPHLNHLFLLKISKYRKQNTKFYHPPKNHFLP